jgi:REP element-mobilizing transposase RayT
MKQKRKTSPRLKGYDYSLAGAYFVTICTLEKVCLFGEIANGMMQLNPSGEIVTTVWVDLPAHYPYVHLDEFIIMPNHVHGILFLSNQRRDRFRNLSLQQHGLSEIIRGFKTWSAKRVNKGLGKTGTPIWQRSFYDRIIRDQEELLRIQEYIFNNPIKWEEDEENPISSGKIQP